MADTETDWHAILSDVLTGIKDLGRPALRKLATEYAPKLAQVAEAETEEEGRARYEAVMLNIKASARVIGIRAETVLGRAVIRTLEVAARFALRAAGV